MATAPPATPEYGLPFVPEIDFAVKDPVIIQGEVIADYEDAFQTLTGIAKHLAPGDPVRLHLLVVCHWLSHQRTLIDFAGKENLLKYAKEQYLDNLAALYGARALRLPAQPATTTLRFSVAAPLAFDVIVPSGTRCQGPSAIEFESLIDAFIGIGTVSDDVPAKAVQAGALGNNFAPGQINSIINWNQPFGVEVTNTTVTAGGSDPEDDEKFRYRVWLAPESFSTCGPRDAYEFWALSAHPDIIQCVVYSAPDIAGEVWLYPLMEGGQLPTTDILQAVEDVCSANTRRPVTDFVTAKMPVEFDYAVNIDYYVLSENDRLLATIQKNVEQAVNDWILWQRSKIGRDINGNELTKRCLEAGAKRIVINLPTPSFQVMAFNQLAICDPTGFFDQTFANGASTSGTPTYTSATAAFTTADIGKSITGTNIPASTTIAAVISGTAITLSHNATATGTALSFTIVDRTANLVIRFAGLEDA
jgi:phage-related baseplate assembly protein